MVSAITTKLLSTVRWDGGMTLEMMETLERVAFRLIPRGLYLEVVEEASKRSLYGMFCISRRLSNLSAITKEEQEQALLIMREQAVENHKNLLAQVPKIPHYLNEKIPLSSEASVKKLVITEKQVKAHFSCYEQFLSQMAYALQCGTWEEQVEIFRGALWFLPNSNALICLSKRLVHMLKEDSQKTKLLAQMHRVFYEVLPVDWNDHLAYNREIEVVMGENVPTEVKLLYQRAISDKRWLYVDMVGKLFCDISLEKLGISPEEAIQKVFETEEDLIFRGLLWVERMMQREQGDMLKGTNEWWELVQKYEHLGKENWHVRRNWFFAYHLCKMITYDTDNAAKYLEDCPVYLNDTQFYVNKTNEVAQWAMEALFSKNNRLALVLIEKLGDFNPFRFDVNEPKTPYFEPQFNYVSREIVRRLIASGYSVQELVDIYMNSYLRSCHSVIELFNALVETKTEIEVQNGKAYIAPYFLKYKLKATLVEKKGAFGLSVLNFNLGTRKYGVVESRHQQYYREVHKKGDLVYGYLVHYDRYRNAYTMRPALDDQDEKDLASLVYEMSFDEMLEQLREVERAGELTTAANHAISKLALDRFMSKKARLLFSMQVVRTVTSIAKHGKETRSFINLINFMQGGKSNPYRHRVSDFIKEDRELSPEQRTELRKHWESLTQTQCSFQELFFIYINTMLKHEVLFSEFVRHFYKMNMVRLEDDLEFNGEMYFLGKIREINTKDGFDYVHFVPFQMISLHTPTIDRYVFRCEDASQWKVGDMGYFTISGYNSSRNCFFIGKYIELKNIGLIFADNTFKGAMNQAAYNLVLTPQLKEELSVDGVTLSVFEEYHLALPMLSAISFRRNDLSAINEYLEIIHKGNPWEKAKGKTPCQGQKLARKNQAKSLLLFLFQQYEERSVRHIYDNSVLRSYFTEEEYEEIHQMIFEEVEE